MARRFGWQDTEAQGELVVQLLPVAGLVLSPLLLTLSLSRTGPPKRMSRLCAAT